MRNGIQATRKDADAHKDELESEPDEGREREGYDEDQGPHAPGDADLDDRGDDDAEAKEKEGAVGLAL